MQLILSKEEDHILGGCQTGSDLSMRFAGKNDEKSVRIIMAGELIVAMLLLKEKPAQQVQ